MADIFTSIIRFFQKQTTLLFVVVIVFLTALVLTIGINRPFVGHHDANNRMYRLAALNYLKHGLIETKLGQVIAPPTEIMAMGHFYTHHPPLLSLFLALSIGIFGDTYWSVRLVPLLFSSITAGVFFLLLRKFFSLESSLLAVGFWLASPMFLFFGKMANHEPLTLLFLTLAVYGWVTKRKRLLYLALFLCQWTGWPAYYLAAIIFIFTRDTKVVLLSLIDAIFFVAHTLLLTGSPTGGGLMEIFLFRTGLSPKVGNVVETYTMQKFLHQEISWLYHLFNPVLVWIASLGVVLILKRKILGEKERVGLTFLLIATIHIFLFRTGANRHDYWLYYYLPFLSWMVGYVFAYFSDRRPLVRRVVVYLVGVLLLGLAIFQGQPFFWALQNRIETTESGQPL